MTNEFARQRSLFRLHCLSRLEKLQTKLEQPDWGMSVGKEFELLCQIQTALTLMLHDIGIECYIAEDWETADRLDNKS